MILIIYIFIYLIYMQIYDQTWAESLWTTKVGVTYHISQTGKWLHEHGQTQKLSLNDWSFTEDLRISLRLWPAYAHLWHSKHVLLHLHVLPCGPGAGCCPATFYDLVGSSVRSLYQKPSNSDLAGLVFWYILVLPMARFYVCSGWWDTQGSRLEK